MLAYSRRMQEIEGSKQARLNPNFNTNPSLPFSRPNDARKQQAEMIPAQKPSASSSVNDWENSEILDPNSQLGQVMKMYGGGSDGFGDVMNKFQMKMAEIKEEVDAVGLPKSLQEQRVREVWRNLMAEQRQGFEAAEIERAARDQIVQGYRTRKAEAIASTPAVMPVQNPMEDLGYASKL